MTRGLVTIPAAAPLNAAATLMQERRIRHLPVVGHNADIIGVVSDVDLARSRRKNASVEKIMTKGVEIINQEAPLRSTILKMLERKLTSVLIFNENQEAVGIVTTDDLLWYLAHLLENETERSKISALLDIQLLNQVAGQISNTGI